MATSPIELAKRIDVRAAEIARGVEREIAIQCAGQPAFMSIILEAVARKVMTMARDATLRADGDAA